MGHNYKMILEYEGTRYNGWQKQGNSENTIQGKLEAVLERMIGAPVEVHGAGRTDAGVHALGQVANFHTLGIKNPGQIREYLNRYLPEDIRVLHVEAAPERFHSRLHAVGKTYRYQIETGQKRDVFLRRYQYGLGRPLKVEEMKRAAELLCGTHDYKSFCGNPRMKKSTVRTVRNIQVCRGPNDSVVTLLFQGDGFLQYMVRIMTGTLIEVGLGERAPGDMPRLLAALNRQEAGFTAPAEGLCLVEVQY